MANYPNPLGGPNPFFTKPPYVIALRHVRRIAATGELVREDGNTLPRMVMRLEAFRSYPQPVVRAPEQRHIPAHGTRLIAW